jgi:20S proteasome alpha/beta subunit
VISTIPTSPHLNTTNNTLFLVNETSSIPYIFDIHPSLTAATAGNAVDGQILRTKLQAFCEHAMETQGEDAVQASVLARRIADHLQLATQTVGGRGGRMLAVR